ncbi:MAG: DNA primase [Mycoplasmataceae bacterium]|nr:DNA primase [Mycoplasmataceae bacterium]
MQGNLKELIKLIEDKVSIVDTVSDYVSLEKKGNNYVGLCPFHSDSNPSMSVSDSKGIFKCFSCGAGGGAITFVQNYEGISFIETVKKISDKANIEWKKYISQKKIKINPEEIRGWEINEEAYIFFRYSLKNSNKTIVKNYINSRGLNEKEIIKFKIGFSGDGSSLTKFLLNKEFTEEEIIKYGLAKRRDDSTLVDYFINRLMFTIENSNGKIIGFSGRVIEKSNYAKYLNSPETPIFKKSNILYNIFNAKISANLKKEIIVVEGFMDVISLYKAGIENSIATMGTSFTPQHIQLVKGITNNITLAFDSDTPGINASILTGKSLISGGMNVHSVMIPSGKDFDELYKLGKEFVVDALKNKTTFLNYYKEKIYSKLDIDTGNIDFNILRELLKLVSLHKDAMISDHTLNEISNKYGISIETLKNEFEKNTLVINEEIQNTHIPDYTPQDFYEKQKNTENKQKLTTDQSQTIKLMFNEEFIVAFAMIHEEAFNYLINNPISFVRSSLHDLWLTFKNSKLENIIIDNPKTLKKIDLMMSQDYISKINPELKEVENMEDYKLFIKNFNEMFNINRKKLLMEEIKKSIDDEEIKFLTSLLKK